MRAVKHGGPRIVARAAVLALALALCPAQAAQQAEPTPQPFVTVVQPQQRLTTAQLIEQLRTGRNLLLIRHERTEVPSAEDDYAPPATNCITQRNLSAAGYAGAQETRVVFRALRIPFVRVLSSPMCRTTETARQMFGKYEVDPRLMHEDEARGRTTDVAARDLQAVMQSVADAEGSVALVTHFGLIFRATGLSLSEGEIAVVRREPGGRLTLLRQIMGSDLAPHAREALGPVRP